MAPARRILMWRIVRPPTDRRWAWSRSLCRIVWSRRPSRRWPDRIKRCGAAPPVSTGARNHRSRPGGPASVRARVEWLLVDDDAAAGNDLRVSGVHVFGHPEPVVEDGGASLGDLDPELVGAATTVDL